MTAPKDQLRQLYDRCIADKAHAPANTKFRLDLNAYCSYAVAKDALQDPGLGWSAKQQDYLVFALDKFYENEDGIQNASLYQSGQRLSRLRSELRLTDDMFWGFHNWKPGANNYLLHNFAQAVFAAYSPNTKHHNWYWAPEGELPRWILAALAAAEEELIVLCASEQAVQHYTMLQGQADLFTSATKSRCKVRYRLLTDEFPAFLATTAETLDFGELEPDYAKINRYSK